MPAAARDSESHPSAPPGQRGAPWADPAWLDLATSWIHAQLAWRGRTVTGPIDEVRKWSISCLLRVPTDRGTVYFKAVPPLFAQEGAITQRLAALFPQDLPTLVAADLPRAWILLEDFGSGQLTGQPLPVWEATMARFARMQVESVPHAESFLAAGLPDRRPRVLADQVARLLDDPLTHEALQPEERHRLRALGPRIHALAQRLARAQPPATLIHGDLDSNNVAIRDGRAVFYDWTDAAVSHPFLDLVVMLPRAQEQLPDHPDAAERVREAYLAVWTEAGFAPTGPTADSLRAVCRDALTAGSLHQAINYRNILAATGREDRPEWLSGLARFLRRALERLATP